MRYPRYRPLKCDLCGSAKYYLTFRRRGPDAATLAAMPHKIVCCMSCGHVYAIPHASPKQVLKDFLFAERGAEAEEEGLRRQARAVLAKISRHAAGGRLLHIGGGPGFFMDEACRAGWSTAGVELRSSRKDGRRSDPEVFRRSLAKAAFPDRSFDAVVLQDVIHHLPSPSETLREIRRILKHDGILFVSTPDIGSAFCRTVGSRWWGINKHHLHYFSGGTLDQMLSKSGFRTVARFPYPRVFSLGYWARRIASYPAFVRKPVEWAAGAGNIGRTPVRVSLGDQIGVIARKVQRLDALFEEPASRSMPDRSMKVIAVLPAYNAEKTLAKTVADIPRGSVDEILLVDDASRDGTVRIAEELGLTVFRHDRNRGYGANQKTCYDRAIERGADIVVMLHPDYQYDPKIIPQLTEPIRRGEADAVFGSRMMKGGALEGGMPLWKHNANILLTAFENVVLRTYLTEYHSGFRAYGTAMLKRLPYRLNSDGFVFDTEIIVQILANRYKIEEVPIRTRYFEEASSIRLWPSIVYGLGILRTMGRWWLHRRGWIRDRAFLPA